MPNPYVNKIQKSTGEVLIDLSTDTVSSAADIIQGKVGHLRDGSVVTGTGSGGGSGGNVWQDQDGYVHLDDEGTTPVTVQPLSVTQNGTYTATTGTAYSPVTVNVSGGASNVVQGTFTGTTTGAAMDVTLNYSGAGYPIAVMIYPTGGAYNENATSGSNAYKWYNLIQRNAIAMYSATKNDPSQVPFQGIYNKATVCSVYKYSDSGATIYSRSSTMSAAVWGAENTTASSSNSTCVTFKSATKMSVFIASTSYGFAANIEYTYQIIYSS